MGFAVVGLFYSGIGWPDSGAWCCLLLRCVGGLRFRCGGFVLVFWWVWCLSACLRWRIVTGFDFVCVWCCFGCL